MNECSIKLVYLGQLRFGELKSHPRGPPRPMPIKGSAKRSTAVEDGEPVGQPAASTETEASASVESVETKKNDLHVQTDKDELHAETTDNIVSLDTVTVT